MFTKKLFWPGLCPFDAKLLKLFSHVYLDRDVPAPFAMVHIFNSLFVLKEHVLV